MKRIVSGIQPSGGGNGLHLGNLLGAVNKWVAMQDEGECFFFIADLHAITVPIPATELKKNVYEMTAMLVACGIDPERTALFSQMMVPEHASLQWILSCTARMGWLSRMTQFKDKGGNDAEEAFRAGFASGQAKGSHMHFEGPTPVDAAWEDYDRTGRTSVGVGLFAYPILQAADVLLYDATHVPVGDDQGQHLQLIRDIAQKFNHDYGVDFFTIPEPVMHGPATRVMSLKNGTKKMSKSDPDDMTRINMTDDDTLIAKKFRRAVTDTKVLPGAIEGLVDRHEVTNLINIYAALVGNSVEDVLIELAGQGHGVLKQRLADCTIATIGPIRERYTVLRRDNEGIRLLLEKGWEKASCIAGEKLLLTNKIVFGY